MNKLNSGFNYRLKLPKKLDSSLNLQLIANLNVLNLVAVKVKPFKAVYGQDTAHTQITEDKVFLLSCVDEFKMEAELVSIDRTQPCPENKLEFKLLKPFTNKHQIILIFADKKKRHAYFCTQSINNYANFDDDYLIDHVHFLKITVDS